MIEKKQSSSFSNRRRTQRPQRQTIQKPPLNQRVEPKPKTLDNYDSVLTNQKQHTNPKTGKTYTKNYKPNTNKQTQRPQKTKAKPKTNKQVQPNHYNTKTKLKTFSKGGLRIIPLGGQEEVGRNMTVFEYGEDIIILDMGMQFPEEDMPGIDYIVPDISYLKGKEKNIRGVIFSHGHLDHVGAAQILLKQLGYPLVVGRDFTMAIVKHRLEDKEPGSSKLLNIAIIKSVEQKMQLGAFTVGFFDVEHSIMDAVGVTLSTPEGTVIHPGDWTLERDDQGNRIMSYANLAKLPRPTFLMLESLGATDYGTPTPEKEMYKNINKLIDDAPKKVIIGTFSSQIRRIAQIIDHAQKTGKKVALDGYSMKMNMKISQELGYIKIHKGTLIDIKDVHKYPDNKIIIVCTGAQGESNAVLSRIINDKHRHIKINKDDTVIFSSSVIPGNERTIQRVKDGLYRKSDYVVHTGIMDVHTSGHCNAEDIKEVIKQVKPDYYLPVYANHYFLKEAAKLAMQTGFDKKKIFILDNGSVLESKGKKPKILNKKAKTDYIFIDGLGIGDVGQIVIRDRQVMSKDGMFTVIVTVNKKTGKIIQNPDIISRGFIYMKESRELVEQARKKVIQIVNQKKGQKTVDWGYVRNELRDKMGDFLYQKTERRPMVLPVIIEV